MIRNPFVRKDKNNFIAMQRPVNLVFSRFWQMIQTFHIRLDYNKIFLNLIFREIICIQETNELAKYIYFPEKKGDIINFDQYSIECISVKKSDFMIKRELRFSFDEGINLSIK